MTTDFVGSGWNYPLTVRGNGAFALAGGADKLEQSMRLILSTYPGERPMRPAFGCRLRDFVFRPTTENVSADLSREVNSSLARWEPRVDVEQVLVYPDQSEDGLLYIDISYRIRATNDRRNLVFPFYTIPEHESE
jgi:phage baseplate assembly protein W